MRMRCALGRIGMRRNRLAADVSVSVDQRAQTPDGEGTVVGIECYGVGPTGGPAEEIYVSVAFTKEDSAETAAETMLPERPVPEGPNLVTAAGLTALQRQVAESRTAYEAALNIEDVNERRRQAANPFRDLRYFSERLRTAQLVPPCDSPDMVNFGCRVTFSRNDGRVQSYRIVGEDEADPKSGSISFASPIARALLGKKVGDVVSLGASELEILSIDLSGQG